MISTSDLKKGVAIEFDGELYAIIDYQHIKMGRGSAQVRLRLRNIRAGHIIERTVQAGERFPRARLDRHTAQYQYEDGGLFNFMDTDTFEQLVLSRDQLGDAINYIKENMEIEVMTYEGDPIGVELPLAVHLQIVETGPGTRGDTAQGGNKPALLETGLTVQVPLFINSGDVIKVDTRSGAYLERVS